MDVFVPKYRRNPNEKILSLYQGIAPGGRTVTTVVKPSEDGQRMVAKMTYGPAIGRGESGRVAVLVLGGMETTLDEMEYILQAKQEKKFIPRRGPREIVDMCRLLAIRRNEQIREVRKQARRNHQTMSKKRTARLYLPRGYRFVDTSEQGLRVLARG